MTNTALVTNDATVLGLLLLVLGGIFYTQTLKDGFFKRFYTYVPALLLCYFIPGLLNTFGIINGEESKLYFVASRYLLPACLVLLTLSVDLKEIIKLGPKVLIVFLAGTFGVIIGGPISILIVKYFMPSVFEGLALDDVWRGMTTVAGSWIGGGANQASMKEVFDVNDKIFSIMVVVDVLVANVWMAVLLFLAPKAKQIDKYTKADTSVIESLKKRLEDYQATNSRIPTVNDLMYICAVAFGITGLAHLGADIIAPFINANAPFLSKFSLTSKFFWLIVIATMMGVGISFSKLNKLEAVGASKVGNIFLYILVATIGMHMNVFEIFKNPGVFLVGAIWITIHAVIILTVGRLVRAPLFFIAVGSQANIGGAASAPVVASFFHPSLAPIGVLLAVLGYVLGTYGAWLCGILMQSVVF
jgi:uncharacterized membrane protein